MAGTAFEPGGSWRKIASMRSVHRAAQREQVARDVATAIAVRNLPNTLFDYPWHVHPEIELNLVVNGRGTRYVGDSISAFEPGEVTLVAGGTPHAWLSPPHQARTDWGIVVQFLPDVFGAGFLGLAATQPLSALFARAARGIVFDGAARAEATRELWRLTDPGLSALGQLSCLLSILTTLATSREQRVLSVAATPAASARETSRAGKVMAYLHDHSAERLSQRAVAALVAMSPGAFSRFFTRHFGKPFVAYVAELRIGNACRLLLERDLGVSEIAYEVGFNNLANFNRHFLKLKGVTPTAYRRIGLAGR